MAGTAAGAGSVRILFSDASGTRRDVVFGEVRTEPLAVSTDPRQQLQVPAGQAVIGQDDKVLVEMKGDATTNVNNNSVIRIPVRIRNIKTNVARETYLTQTDIGLTSTNVAIGTSFTQFGSYTVNAQEQVKLGHITQVNSQVYMSLNGQ